MSEVIWIAVAGGVAGLVHGLTGLGFAIVLVTMLVMAGGDVVSSSMIAMIATGFAQGTILWQLRGRLAFSAIWPVLVGSVVALPVGLIVLKTFGADPWMRRAFGLFVAAAALWLLVMPERPHVTPKPRLLLGVGAGLLSGLGAGMFNISGPPAALYVYSRSISLDLAKASIQWLFTCLTLYRMVMASAEGMLHWSEVACGLVSIPLVVAGALGGLALAKRFHPDALRKGVYAMLVIIGLKLCVFP